VLQTLQTEAEASFSNVQAAQLIVAAEAIGDNNLTKMLF
jgi:hypothetical protein